jgi:hypothetical protein
MLYISKVVQHLSKPLTLDPDIIFIDAAGLPLVADDVARNSGFYKGLKAFSRRRVYILHPFNWYTTNIDTALADAYAMGKILYGKQFEDIYPERKADEIYTESNEKKPGQQRLPKKAFYVYRLTKHFRRELCHDAG